jgi:beta-barrel assembly-enhancing protease
MIDRPVSRAWPAFHYDGRNADRQPITLSIEPSGVRLHLANGRTTLWPIHALRQAQGSFSSEQVRLELGSEPTETVLVNEPGFLEAMRSAFPESRRALHGRRQTTRLLAWSVGVVAAAVALYVLGAPVAADWMTARVPPAWEATLGQGVEERVRANAKYCGDSLSLAELRGVLDRLIDASDNSRYAFRMVVLRDSQVNAFAAPGGFIAVHSGLLEAAETPEEFAGVLAHEVQHVLLRHSTRGIIREVPLRIGIATITGGTGMESIATAAGSLGALRYRRGDESEADREGLRLLAAARIAPGGMVTFMRTLDRQDVGTPRLASYLSSHPHTPDRVAELEALARRTRVDALAIMPASRWEHVRRLCRG